MRGGGGVPGGGGDVCIYTSPRYYGPGGRVCM